MRKSVDGAQHSGSPKHESAVTVIAEDGTEAQTGAEAQTGSASRPRPRSH